MQTIGRIAKTQSQNLRQYKRIAVAAGVDRSKIGNRIAQPTFGARRRSCPDQAGYSVGLGGGVGRGLGVARGLGLGVGLGVAVGLAVAVAVGVEVAVAVAVAVAVGVGDAVGLGVGVPPGTRKA
jgi:hypothetical protein